MKRTMISAQADLFRSVPSIPIPVRGQQNYEELVVLLSSLLWEVVLEPLQQTSEENAHEQDHR